MSRLRRSVGRLARLVPDAAIASESLERDLIRRETAASLGLDLPVVGWTDDWITYALARSGSYELTHKYFIARALAPVLERDGLALDIGANVGTYAMALSRMFSRVIAIDPSVQACQMLGLTLELHGITNVDVRNVALGDSSGVARLALPRQRLVNRGMARIVEPGESEIEGTEVRVERGDELVRGLQPVRFIKVDVEGSEISVIRGLADTLARDRPVVSIELLTRQSASRMASELSGTYEGFGLRPQKGERVLVPLDEIPDPGSLDLAFFLPSPLAQQLAGVTVPEYG